MSASPAPPGSPSPSASSQLAAGTINPGSKKAATPATAAQAAKAKSMNVFTNDGSFLERFKKMKEGEVEKKKQADALARKRAFEDRIKNRGKRPASGSPLEDNDLSPPSATKKLRPSTTAEDSKTGATSASSGAGRQGEETAYMREVRKLQGHDLTDRGAGVPSLVK